MIIPHHDKSRKRKKKNLTKKLSILNVYINFKLSKVSNSRVGPSEISPLTFSKNGHYLVISDIDSDNNFYVINSNEIGDTQLGIPFDYETIIKNMTGRKDSFNFLFIKKLDKCV